MGNFEESAAAISLMAALADGDKNEFEQNRLKDIFTNLKSDEQVSIYEKVLLKKTSLEQECSALTTPENRLLVFEMAVSICDADDKISYKEFDFLEKLRGLLEIPKETAENILEQGAKLAQAAQDDEMLSVAPDKSFIKNQPAANSDSQELINSEAESMILKNAILCGGIELLPDSISTIAIIPLQMRLVYAIGRKYGFQLDRGHIKELFAAVGIGMTSQVLEGIARKFLGGLFKKVGGDIFRGLAKGATGVVMTFATTFALGRLAKIYYSSGRQIAMSDLKNIFQKELGNAKGLYDKYAPEIQNKAQTLTPASVLSMVKDKGV